MALAYGSSLRLEAFLRGRFFLWWFYTVFLLDLMVIQAPWTRVASFPVVLFFLFVFMISLLSAFVIDLQILGWGGRGREERVSGVFLNVISRY